MMNDIWTTTSQHKVHSEVPAILQLNEFDPPLQDPKVSPIGRARTSSIASLVFGIASIPLVNFIFGIIGLVIARHALKATPAGVDNRFCSGRKDLLDYRYRLKRVTDCCCDWFYRISDLSQQ